MIDETIHTAAWGWAFNDFRPSYTSRDYREISVWLDAIMLFMEGAGERNSEESLQKKWTKHANENDRDGMGRGENNGNTCKYCDRPSYCARTV